MTLLTSFFLVSAVFIAGLISAFIGEILAHLVLYHRRGQAVRSKRKRDGNSIDLLDLIKYD